MKLLKIIFHPRNTEVLPPQQVICEKDVILAPNGQKYRLYWDEKAQKVKLRAEGVTWTVHEETTDGHVLLKFE